LSEHPLDRTLLLLQLDAFPGLDLAAAARTIMTTRVKITADESSLSSNGGQTALTATFLALSQMGLRITLDVPDVPVFRSQPPLCGGGGIHTALTRHAADLIQPCVSDGAHDMVIALGAADAGADSYRLHGSDWGARIELDGGPKPWTAESPIGGALAGVLAGSAALPIIVRRLEVDQRLAAPDQFRAVRPVVAIELPSLDVSKPLDVGDVDVISGGAITNAALFALLRCDLDGRFRVFDNDRCEITNLNRYVLMRRSDIGALKVQNLERLTTDRFLIKGVPQRYDTRSQLELGPCVLVGADNIQTRHVVQSTNPNWLHVGGTTHFEVISTSHSGSEPCAGCLHPRTAVADPGVIPTISFVSLLAGTLQAYALLAHVTGKACPGYYCWAINLGGPSGVVAFRPRASPDCPLACEASQCLRVDAA